MGKALLLVEDEAELLLLWTELLESRGHAVVGAATVEQGRAALSDDGARFDLALIDWTLPDGTGGDVILHARCLGNVDTLVLTSGLSNRELGKHSADHVLGKPFRMRELIALVEQQ